MFFDLFGNRRAKLGLHIHTNLSDGAVSPEEAATTRTITVIFASTACRVKNRVCQQPPVETVCICGGVWQASHALRRYADVDENFLRAFVNDEDGRQAWTNIVRL